jgi:hypothetical protein
MYIVFFLYSCISAYQIISFAQQSQHRETQINIPNNSFQHNSAESVFTGFTYRTYHSFGRQPMHHIQSAWKLFVRQFPCHKNMQREHRHIRSPWTKPNLLYMDCNWWHLTTITKQSAMYRDLGKRRPWQHRGDMHYKFVGDLRGQAECIHRGQAYMSLHFNACLLH